MAMYYRLYQELPSYTALGFGKASGRWNNRYIPMIYATNTVSLSFLEQIAIKGPLVTKAQWKLASLEIRGSVPQVIIEDLPSDWKARPHSWTTRNFGSEWVKSKQSPILAVPSAIITESAFPQEHNLLINPIHPDFEEFVTFKDVQVVEFQVAES